MTGMRVLHVYNQHRSGGGATKVTQDTIALLQRNGVDVEVFTRRSADIPKGLSGHLAAGLGAFTGGPAKREFLRVLDSFRPDLVHAHELFPMPSPWILPECTRRGVPVVMNWNDYHLTCPTRNHYRQAAVCTKCVGGREYNAVLNNCRGNLAESATMALYCAILRKRKIYQKHVAHFIVLSEFSRRWLIDNAGVDPDRVTTISPIIPPAEPVPDPAAGTYVAFGGRFVPEKGIDTLLEAARLSQLPVKLSRNQAHFVTIDIPGNVEVVVTSTAEEVIGFYRGARVVVMPSSWFETFGMVAAEAMSHGVPVVVSRIGALANLIDDGVDGLLFEPGNARDLAAKLQMIWNDDAFARRIGEAGRKKALSCWGERTHRDRLMTVYESVVRQKHAHVAASRPIPDLSAR